MPHTLAPIMLLGLPLLIGLATPAPALAQEAQRESYLIVYGDDACPQAEEDVIYVCARRPEAERYRIPPRYRENPNRVREMAWGARAMDLEEAQRDTRPGGCSANGSFGQGGCTWQMVRQWYYDRAVARERSAE